MDHPKRSSSSWLHEKILEDYFMILEEGENVGKLFGQSTKMSEHGSKNCKNVGFFFGINMRTYLMKMIF